MTTARPLRLLAGLTILGALGAPTATAQPIKVGEEVPFQAASPHPYPRGGSAPVWQVTIDHPGATYIAVHFDRFELVPGDRLIVRSDEGLQHHSFTGRGKGQSGSFWATHVKGDHAVVELFARASRGAAWGVSIDRYAAGTMDLGAELASSPEAICGADDKINAVCAQGEDPPAYASARAVARLLIGGFSACTGWLVGCEGHLITNEHCITSQAQATSTDVEFMFEAPSCGAPCAGCTGTVWPGELTLIKDSATHDYSFLLLSGNPQATYGSLLLDDRLPVPGERIYIPQHPGSRAKEIAVVSTDPNDPDGVCEVSSIDELPCSGGPGDVGYFCDTEGGSSGSPVIARADNKVIALHHCASCANRGVRITEVIADLGSLLPACALVDTPSLELHGHLIDDSAGNGDGVADPGESLLVPVDLRNVGSGTATGISGQISTATPGVLLADPSASWADAVAGMIRRTSAPHFAVDLAGEIPCGSTITLDLTVGYDQGTLTDRFHQVVGTNVLPAVEPSSTDTPLGIPDNAPAGVASSILVPQSFPVADVDVSLDISHTFVGDLVVGLMSPAGTMVFLHNRTGGSGDDIQTTYDDLRLPDGPGEMSDFTGEPSAGTWTLAVQDNAALDVGVLNGWSLHLSPSPSYACSAGQDYVLLPPAPGVAGATNSFEALGGTPGEVTFVVYGFAEGSFPVPGCPEGVNAGLVAPQVLGSAVSAGFRSAAVTFDVPAAATGKTVLLQAVQLSTCTVSNLVSYTFP